MEPSDPPPSESGSLIHLSAHDGDADGVGGGDVSSCYDSRSGSGSIFGLSPDDAPTQLIAMSTAAAAAAPAADTHPPQPHTESTVTDSSPLPQLPSPGSAHHTDGSAAAAATAATDDDDDDGVLISLARRLPPAPTPTPSERHADVILGAAAGSSAERTSSRPGSSSGSSRSSLGSARGGGGGGGGPSLYSACRLAPASPYLAAAAVAHAPQRRTIATSRRAMPLVVVRGGIVAVDRRALPLGRMAAAAAVTPQPGSSQRRDGLSEAAAGAVTAAVAAAAGASAEAPPAYLRVMVAGGPALGKTRWIRNLAHMYGSSTDPALRTDEQADAAGRSSSAIFPPDGPTSLAIFRTRPDALAVRLGPIPLPTTSGRRLHLTLQDTPSLGGTCEEAGGVREPGEVLRDLMSYLATQLALDHEFAGGATALATGGSADGLLPYGVNLCVYFLPPHRLRPCDLAAMSALSRLAPLLPVLAHADSMEPHELERYRQQVAGAMASYQLQGEAAPIRVAQFDPWVIDALGLDPHRRESLRTGVFAVMASETLATVTPYRSHDGSAAAAAAVSAAAAASGSFPHALDDNGDAVESGGMPPASAEDVAAGLTADEPVAGFVGTALPARCYGWGCVGCADRRHSDTVLLARLLLEGVWPLLRESNRRYAAFCTEYDAANRNLGALVDRILVPYEHDDGGLATATAVQLRRELTAVQRRLDDEMSRFAQYAEEREAEMELARRDAAAAGGGGDADPRVSRQRDGAVGTVNSYLQTVLKVAAIVFVIDGLSKATSVQWLLRRIAVAASRGVRRLARAPAPSVGLTPGKPMAAAAQTFGCVFSPAGSVSVSGGGDGGAERAKVARGGGHSGSGVMRRLRRGIASEALEVKKLAATPTTWVTGLALAAARGVWGAVWERRRRQGGQPGPAAGGAGGN
ncbi:hypothetical protein PLESTM_000457100 [Pleodorina starrii]|nr:hypothetical protein PLESTM_000457100 [Pleodorina starrii]